MHNTDMSTADNTDFHNLFLHDTPLMDVRAPVEFSKGAFPTSHNLPLLDDRQRELIGTRYKQHGQDAAIALGLELATDDIRAQRLQQWMAFIRQHPNGYLYCFRGGLRSRTTQSWLKQQGIHYPLIPGGYKAMRNYLLEALQQNAAQQPMIVLSGMTGSGKTRVLQTLPHTLDLEHLANHKGSAFGRDVKDLQPTPINFENSLSIALLKHVHYHPETPLILEDEGKRIGRLQTPLALFDKMTTAPRLFLERSTAERVVIIREDYIDHNWPLYRQHFGTQAEAQFQDFVLNNLARIKNRLGGVRYREIHQAFSQALAHFFATSDSHKFEMPIQRLLTEYYDPMYQYQLHEKPLTFLFKGNAAEIQDWVAQNRVHTV